MERRVGGGGRGDMEQRGPRASERPQKWLIIFTFFFSFIFRRPQTQDRDLERKRERDNYSLLLPLEKIFSPHCPPLLSITHSQPSPTLLTKFNGKK